MRKTILVLAACALGLLPLASIAGGNFDGDWHTKLTCPPKGNTQGYTWVFESTIQNGNLHGERGATGQPGYLVLEGKIKDDGTAKLNVNGIVVSREYARGIFTGKGDDYSYGVKAEFTPTQGSGVRNEGLGIIGRACTFEFVKHAPAGEAAEPGR